MDILLVDDDLDVLEGISDGVDFEGLGFEQVYAAQNGERAKELLKTKDIAVMVTDIEMPGGSGLELLKWVRDSQLEVVTLFCTSFAYFDYAQKAVELHSFDYFLKPVAYSVIQERLAAAVQEALRVRSLARFSQNLESIRQEAKKNFWQQLLFHNAFPEGKESSEPGEYTADSIFTIAVFSLADGQEPLSSWKRYAVRNVLEELAQEAGVLQEAILTLRSGVWCGVFTDSCDALAGLFERLGAFAKEHLDAWFNCFYSVGVSLDQAQEEFGRLRACETDDVSSKGLLCLARDYRKRNIPYSLPKLREWETMLAAGRHQEVAQDVCAHLDRQAALGRVNMPYIKSMRIDMMQMIHTVLQQQGIQAHALFSTLEFDGLRECSLYSLDHMKEYLCYILRTAGEYMEFADKSQSVVDKMKEYINAHFSEDINRNSLAGIVFLNPDYLARLFKKETGQSISGYVQDVRIREAKSLLVSPGVQVNEVALRVGYDNFSYFSHVFRGKTGVTPNEYRQMHRPCSQAADM